MTLCHFYEAIREHQQWPGCDIASCYHKDGITKCFSEKGGHSPQACSASLLHSPLSFNFPTDLNRVSELLILCFARAGWFGGAEAETEKSETKQREFGGPTPPLHHI